MRRRIKDLDTGLQMKWCSGWPGRVTVTWRTRPVCTWHGCWWCCWRRFDREDDSRMSVPSCLCIRPYRWLRWSRTPSLSDLLNLGLSCNAAAWLQPVMDTIDSAIRFSSQRHCHVGPKSPDIPCESYGFAFTASAVWPVNISYTFLCRAEILTLLPRSKVRVKYNHLQGSPYSHQFLVNSFFQ